jgi:two-component system, OmpR family, KDP operon response regulator KdpE
MTKKNIATILVIDDELSIRRFLKASLHSGGFKSLEAENGTEGLALASSHNPELVLLDLGLPDMDGLEVVLQLRKWAKMPIIILSARGKEQDKIAALDAGADDYLTKPFSVEELKARIRVALRRLDGTTAEEKVFETGNMKVDFAQKQVFIGNQSIHLTPTEFKMLALMARNPGKLITQPQLLKEVWGPAASGDSQALRVHLHQLRQKIEKNPAQPRYLITEAGIGYRLKCDSK